MTMKTTNNEIVEAIKTNQKFFSEFVIYDQLNVFINQWQLSILGSCDKIANGTKNMKK